MSNILLPEPFRGWLKSKIRNMPGWNDYRLANGIGYSELDKQTIIKACDHFGLNIEGLRAEFAGDVCNGLVAETKRQERNFETARAGFEGRSPEGFEGRSPDEIIAEALAPIEVHMTNYLKGQLPALLAPIASAAVQGPRLVTTLVQAAPASGEAPIVFANEVGRKSIREAFALKRNEGSKDCQHALDYARIPMCDFAGAPSFDREYIWRADHLALLGVADELGMNVWLYGPAGTGKTEAATQYAAKLRRPFVRIALDGTTEAPDIIGQPAIKPDGKGANDTVWRDGKLTRAFRTPYCVILIDEPSLVKSSTLAMIQTALDTREIYLPTGELVRAAPGVFVLAADNTAGSGDDSGRYVGTAPLNAAFMDRFAFRIGFDHLSVSQETTMVSHRSGLVAEAVKIMVEYAALTRKDCDAGKLTMGVTSRRLVSWAKGVKGGVGSAQAFSATIVQGAAPEDRETLLSLEQTSLKSDHAKIDGLARGNWQEPAIASPFGAIEPSDTGNKYPPES